MQLLRQILSPSLIFAAVLWTGLAARGEIPQARAKPSELIRQEPEPKWKKEIRAALEKRVSFDFVDVSFADAVAYLSQVTGVQMVLDPEAVDGEKVGVTLKVNDMRVERAMKMLMKRVGLEFSLKYGAIFISTADRVRRKSRSRTSDLTGRLPASMRVPVRAEVDLGKVDRTLRKEPDYRSHVPLYCLVVLGAKAEKVIWLVLDDRTLYVDRNGNRDLTDEGERVDVVNPNLDPTPFHKVAIECNGSRIDLQFVYWGGFNGRLGRSSVSFSVHVAWGDDAKFGCWGDEKTPLLFDPDPAKAPVLYFGGPLVMGFEIRKPFVRKGPNLFELSAAVGTRGRGPGAFTWLGYNVIPKEVYPTASIEFPSATVGGKPVHVEMRLKQRC